MYGLNNCDTCKKARKWLDQQQIGYAWLDLRQSPPSATQLQQWQQSAGSWEALINRSSTTWRTLSDAQKASASTAEALSLLQEFPALLKRPLLMDEKGRLLQGFKPDVYSQWLGLK